MAGYINKTKKEVVLMEYSELKKRHFGTNDTDKKLTDEEIISSLELIATTRNCNECKIRNCKWGTCNCEQITANAALDLIKPQKIEIERLRKEVNLISIQFQDLQERYEESQAEIKRLKECPKCVYEYDGEVTEYCIQGPCPNFKPVYVSKDEAYKEFAEELKHILRNTPKALFITRQEAEKALEKMK